MEAENKKYINNNWLKSHRRIPKLNPVLILRVYKLLKENPDKIFKRSDFMDWNHSVYTLKLLYNLNLIEVVPITYRSGKRYKICKSVLGFKFKVENGKRKS